MRSDLRARVDAALADFLRHRRVHLSSIDPAMIACCDAVEAFVLGGGKRLRPSFAYWGYRGAGGVDRDEVIAAVASLELVQASALMHDDLMDGSATRRGEPSVHKRFQALHEGHSWEGLPEQFGAAAAILLGDLCLVWSDELLHASGVDPATIARARPVFDQMRTEVMAGQYLDVFTVATADTSVARASQVARFKSAKYTVEHPLLFGAALAGAPEHVSHSYSAFGLPLGEAFQLRDDVLGVFGDPATTGKPAGDDLREGKRTYLVAMAFEHGTEQDRRVLTEGLGNPALDLDRMREIIVRSRALARTEARIDELAELALKELQAAEITPDAAAVLAALAEAAVNRST